MVENEKEKYRKEILRLEKYVKYMNVCETLKISYTNLRAFKQGDDRKMSVKSLQRIEDFVNNNYELEVEQYGNKIGRAHV